MIIAIYARYNKLEEETFGTMESAKDFLNVIEENGQGFAIGIYNSETKEAFITIQKIGFDDSALLNIKMNDLKRLGYDVKRTIALDFD